MCGGCLSPADSRSCVASLRISPRPACSGDDNLLTWTGGIGLLTQLGMHGVEVESGNDAVGYAVYSSAVRTALLAAGQNITSSAEYAAPGSAPATGANTPASLAAWAQKVAAPFAAAGYTPEQMTVFALADEPGWDFPSGAPEAFYAGLKPEWEAFLQAQHLQPAVSVCRRRCWYPLLPSGQERKTTRVPNPPTPQPPTHCR